MTFINFRFVEPPPAIVDISEKKMRHPFVDHRLPNGLRIVIEAMPGVHSAAAGFYARTGGRDETRELAGVSHFLEHMCFKGTSKRTWHQITLDFDDMGSTYNAYTMKDRTFYYGWVPRERIAAQIELLADMMQSALPPAEFDMEKNVILEEIAMSNDQLDALAYDFLNEQVFAGHPLAWPVLGYDRTVSDMQRDQMHDYFVGRYAPNNLVLVAAGNVDAQQIIDLADKLCGEWKPSPTIAGRSKPDFVAGRSQKVFERFNRQELCHVFPSTGGNHPLEESAEAAASILGGENSRFYWHIVQEGIAPHAAVWRIDYQDCGLMVMAGECDADKCEQLADAMRIEAEKFTGQGAKPEEVQRVKNRRRTSLAIESESPYYRLGQLLDDIDYRGGPRTVGQRLAEVDAVSPKSIAEYLEAYPITTGGHFISVGPRAWLPSN